jgi:ribonuclease D
VTIIQPCRLAHEDLMQLPIIRYTGPLHVCATDADLAAAANAIRHERVIGFDTEARPTFRKGPAHPPCLVQIATGTAVYLFQLQRLDCVPVLTTIFENARIRKAGIAIGRDLSELQKLFPFQSAGVLDLGDIAKKNGLEQTGIRNLAGLFLQARITKSAQTSNWAAPELSTKQLTYAATDAWICRELFLKFESFGWLV